MTSLGLIKKSSHKSFPGKYGQQCRKVVYPYYIVKKVLGKSIIYWLKYHFKYFFLSLSTPVINKGSKISYFRLFTIICKAVEKCCILHIHLDIRMLC